MGLKSVLLPPHADAESVMYGQHRSRLPAVLGRAVSATHVWRSARLVSAGVCGLTFSSKDLGCPASGSSPGVLYTQLSSVRDLLVKMGGTVQNLGLLILRLCSVQFLPHSWPDSLTVAVINCSLECSLESNGLIWVHLVNENEHDLGKPWYKLLYILTYL